MKALKLFHEVYSLATIIAIVFFAPSKSETSLEQEKVKAEEMFKEIHGDLSKLYLLKWNLAENITEERLEKACRDVATAISPGNSTTYLPPTKQKPEERVIKEAPILLAENTYITYTKLINCTFADMTFYLAQANDEDHVFCLTWQMNHIFGFRSGPHEIHY